jgi:hypothetical protein
MMGLGTKSRKAEDGSYEGEGPRKLSSGREDSGCELSTMVARGRCCLGYVISHQVVSEGINSECWMKVGW